MRLYVWSLALVPALGCVGAIGDEGAPGSGAPGSGAPGSGTGDSGIGTSAPGACIDALPARRVWTLSRNEYDNSVAAVLGDTSNQAQSTFPGEIRANGFVDNAQSEIVTSATITPMMTAAETIASASVSNELKFIKSTLTCTLAAAPSTTSPDACAIQYIKARGGAFFRRPLTDQETTDLYESYVTGFGNPFPGIDAGTSAVENVLATILQMPQFFYRTEFGSPTDTTSSSVQMTQYEIASAISFMATASPPDATLLASAAAGALSTPAAIAAQYQRLVSTPRGHAQMEQFVLQWLGEDQIASYSRGPVTQTIATDMLTEAKGFVEEAVFSGAGTVEELLTGSYTFANADLATFYGLQGVSSSTFGKVPLDSASGRAGLLSQGAFLISNSQTGVPLLHRGLMIREHLLCETLPSFASVGFPPNFTPPPFPTPPQGTTTRQALTKEITGPCLTCHQYFMSLGFGLEHFDSFGRYQAMQNGGTVDPSGAILESTSIDPASGLIVAPATHTQTTFPDSRGLASKLAANPRTSLCLADNVVMYASGQGAQLNECAVQNALTPPAGSSAPSVQQQFMTYVQSKDFVWRSR